MASLQIARPPFLGFSRKSSGFMGPRILKLCRDFKYMDSRSHGICCRLQEGENEPNKGEEPPESLFMKELRRRGIIPTSLLEDSKRSRYGLDEKEVELKEDGGGSFKRNALSTDYEKGLANQRERSMELNSEGLEGLIPRAKLLLTIGGTFFLGFGPLILITVSFFSALYLYFGQSFVHDASKMPVGSPPYLDPYALLEDERLSQSAPLVK